MKQRSLHYLLLVCLLVFIATSCSTPINRVVKREGDKEYVTVQEDGKIIHQLVYTYRDGKKVMGEYWKAVSEKDGPEKFEPNKLAETEFAKIIEQALADEGIAITNDVELMQVKNGLQLKFVKMVDYDGKGRPVTVRNRGITSFPVIGSFTLKNNLSYQYNDKGQLNLITETNLNIDSALLNMAVINITTLKRDTLGRPLKVTKVIGSVPPALEETEYSYYSNSPDMKSTRYTKSAIDLSELVVTPSEIIIFGYQQGVPWDGKKKYELSLGILESLSIIDAKTNTSKLSVGSSLMEQAMFAKALYNFKENEEKGPKWRMGELPDVPEPFLLYGDAVWW